MSKGSAGKVIAGLGLGIAVGTAFGFYALAPNVEGGPGGSSASVQQELNAEKASREAAEGEVDASNDVLSGVAKDAVSGDLKGQSVVLFVTPDANSETVNSTRKLVQDAGANVTGVVNLTDKILQQDSGDETKSIAANSLPAGAKLSEKNLNPGMHAGELVGAALSTKDEASDSDRAVALGSLEQADLISYEGEAPGAADLGLVIGGEESEDYSTSFLADFVMGLDENFEGAVLAAPHKSAEDSGAVGRVRDNREYTEQVSTVDNVDTEAGRITVVRALKQQAEGEAGHYGAANNAAAATVE